MRLERGAGEESWDMKKWEKGDEELVGTEYKMVKGEKKGMGGG